MPVIRLEIVTVPSMLLIVTKEDCLDRFLIGLIYMWNWPVKNRTLQNSCVMMSRNPLQLNLVARYERELS